MHQPSLFESFFLGGFECSTQRRRDGRRLDLTASTQHDRLAAADYSSVARHGIRTVRDGVRWHLIEGVPGQYDWSSLLPMVRSARDSGIQVIWDLCHYGWPDDIDIWRPEFVERFAQFAAAVARLMHDEGLEAPMFCPINEISYWAWAGGTTARFNPSVRGRGDELKFQLVRATIAAIERIRECVPRARFVQVDPLIHIVSRSRQRRDHERIEGVRLAQYHAWDLLIGTEHPGLGGKPEYLDIIGVNYYSDNQWYANGQTIAPQEPAYRPFHEILAETHRRYQRPILIAETGAEGDERVPWLRYVCDQVEVALKHDIPLEGICLYPITDYPGWSNYRHCRTGLLGYPDPRGTRPLYEPLAEEIACQRMRFDTLLKVQSLADALTP
ncbi:MULTISPECIES: beta-glucosidase [Halomonadaceae]|uniref:beta-glucosidase n=1 Tax=Halomonadaceae TaxID=28256 RepID=UPI001599245A|nr:MULTISPECIES: beta-glucosidase [Halomonas]QJQ93860.1 beta-glucosidase [Halomonas sp. PA5]